MWYIKPNYSGKLTKFGEFDRARVLVLEDKYSHIVPITAKEGRIKFGETEDHFCNPTRHVIYDLNKRGNLMLTQLSKMENLSNSKIQQVSKTLKI